MKNSDSERIIRDLFSSAGIAINGENPYDIQVHNDQFYQRVLAESSLGFGESFMDGWWDCDAIDQLVCKMHKANVREKVKGNLKVMLPVVKSKLLNLQAKTRAYEIGKKHYDIGNDLYQRMLGRTMAYTSAYWKHAKNLDDAQEAKMDLVCKKTNLRPGMTVLELGCGWGSFAKYAAEKYGVEVTGVTVSKEQVELGNERCKGLPIEIKLDDYRNVKGRYDVVISIGILEHVGYKNYRTYMEVANRCLKDDGIAFAHTIGGNTSRTAIDPWIDKYIFPNAMLPSIAQLANAMEGIFVVEDWHNFGPDYDTTLMAWHKNFENAWPELKNKYGRRFYRMWKFYLLSCAGGFRARYNQLWQIVMTKQGRSQPECRFN